MRYISLFSGIEAASAAWGPLGWEPVAFSEIDAFPKAVLAERFPGVPDLGDITRIDWSGYESGAVDVVVGGSPCQSFSLAGKREGLRGASGLMYEYIRAVRELRPRWFVWENVPGALSSEGGRAFGQLLSRMDGLGYGLAWRILDAQFFGVAQRRRRVFLVGSLGSTRSSEVLFEPEGMSWDFESGCGKRQALAGGAQACARSAGFAGGTRRAGCLTSWDTQARRIYRTDGVYPALDARDGKAGADGKAVFLGDDAPTVWCSADSGAHGEVDADLSPTLTAHNSKGANFVAPATGRDGGVRRLTPVECERLQGFPDGWTDVPYRGECHPADGPRYKALGNSMAVPVMAWIGRRIALAAGEVVAGA